MNLILYYEIIGYYIIGLTMRRCPFSPLADPDQNLLKISFVNRNAR